MIAASYMNCKLFTLKTDSRYHCDIELFCAYMKSELV